MRRGEDEFEGRDGQHALETTRGGETTHLRRNQRNLLNRCRSGSETAHQGALFHKLHTLPEEYTNFCSFIALPLCDHSKHSAWQTIREKVFLK